MPKLKSAADLFYIKNNYTISKDLIENIYNNRTLCIHLRSGDKRILKRIFIVYKEYKYKL